MSNDNFAKRVVGRYGAYSLLGPKREIGFDDAAIFWLAFYHLAFKIEVGKMVKRNVVHAAENMSMLLEEPINYFTKKKGNPGYEMVKIHHTDPT